MKIVEVFHTDGVVVVFVALFRPAKKGMDYGGEGEQRQPMGKAPSENSGQNNGQNTGRTGGEGEGQWSMKGTCKDSSLSLMCAHAKSTGNNHNHQHSDGREQAARALM